MVLVADGYRLRWDPRKLHDGDRDIHRPLPGGSAEGKLDAAHARFEPDELELPVEDQRAVVTAVDHAAGVPSRVRRDLSPAIVPDRRRSLHVVVGHGVEVRGRVEAQHGEVERGAVAVGDEVRREGAAVALDHDVRR